MAKKQAKPAKLTFDCITFEQSGHTLVLFCASAKALWKITQVNQREEDSEDGYQRAVSPSRARKLSSFIDKGNVIPTSVLISFEHAKLRDKGTKLVVDNRKDAGWVIDGQHRLAGGNNSESDIILPVVAFTGLGVTDQIQCFVTINKEQRGVPSSLYLELLKNIPGKRDPAQEAKELTVDIAHEVKRDEASPFYGRIISTTSPRKGELSLTNFVRKVSPMVKTNGRLATFTHDERCGIINNYYKGLMQAFPKEYERPDSVFFKTIGFGALMGVLPTFLDVTLSERRKFRVADTASMFKRISHFDFSEWRGLSSSGAENSAADDLRAEILDYGKSEGSHGTIEL